MKRRNVVYTVLLALIFLLGCGQNAANSQQAAPKDNKGFKATVKQVVDLGPEIEGMQGRQLRMRLLTSVCP